MFALAAAALLAGVLVSTWCCGFVAARAVKDAGAALVSPPVGKEVSAGFFANQMVSANATATAMPNQRIERLTFMAI